MAMTGVPGQVPESLSSPRGLQPFGSVPSTLDPWPATYVSGAPCQAHTLEVPTLHVHGVL